MLPCTGLVHHVPHPGSGDNSMRRYALSALWRSSAGVPAVLAAQGFSLYEQGTCAMGRAGTGVAAPCADGSAIFFNPAGLAGVKGGRATIGVTLLRINGGFTDDVLVQRNALQEPLLAIPQVYLSYAATPKLGVGVGLFAPYALETQWPLAFDGRFSGYKNVLRSIYIQPTVAYQVTPWLALGGGLDIVMGKVELNQRLDLAEAPLPTTLLPPPPGAPPYVFGQFGIAPGTDFADAHLEATKTTVTAHWGGIIKVNDKLSIGGRYLMHAKLDYSGTGTFTQVATNLIVPSPLPVGPVTIPAGCPIDNLLMAERYHSANGFRFAAEWANDAKWTFRGGYLYHQGAAPPETVTPLLPEGNRNEVTAGLTVQLAPGLTGDLAYQYVKQNDRRGRTREPTFNQLPTTGMNNGLYKLHAHLFGVSLSYAF